MWIIIGVSIGFINGFFGGGGGMIAVPMLSSLAKFSTQKAHANAILVILPITVISALVYLFEGNFKWGIHIPVTIGSCIGGVIGAKLLKRLSAKNIQLIFIIMLIVVGLKMLF